MPYATHIKITCSGTLSAVLGSPEIFSYSFALNNPDGTEPDASQYTNYETVINAFHGSTLLRVSAQAVLTQIKYSRIDTAGHTVGTPHYQFPDVPGDAASYNYPFQIAGTVSLNAASSSRRAKGRFYLPFPQWSFGGSGHWGDGPVADALTAAVALVGGLNEVDVNRPVVVASGVDGNHRVTHVRIGNVPATVRKRRNQLAETYQESIV